VYKGMKGGERPTVKLLSLSELPDGAEEEEAVGWCGWNPPCPLPCPLTCLSPVGGVLSPRHRMAFNFRDEGLKCAGWQGRKGFSIIRPNPWGPRAGRPR